MQTLGILMATLALIAGWMQYRLNMFDERKRILQSLRSLLDVVSMWAGTSYTKNTKEAAWFNPGKSVYKINSSSVITFLESNLISKEFSSLLTYFIQLTERFNQRIDMYNQFIFSDLSLFFKATSFIYNNQGTGLMKSKKDEGYLPYEDCYNKVEELKKEGEKNKDKEKLYYYLKKTYKLQEIIHTDGIGDNSYFDESNFPKFHKCYLELECALKVEKLRKRWFLRDDPRYVIGDIVFLVIPLAFILFSLVAHFIF